MAPRGAPSTCRASTAARPSTRSTDDRHRPSRPPQGSRSTCRSRGDGSAWCSPGRPAPSPAWRIARLFGRSVGRTWIRVRAPTRSGGDPVGEKRPLYGGSATEADCQLWCGAGSVGSESSASCFGLTCSRVGSRWSGPTGAWVGRSGGLGETGLGDQNDLAVGMAGHAEVDGVWAFGEWVGAGDREAKHAVGGERCVVGHEA